MTACICRDLSSELHRSATWTLRVTFILLVVSCAALPLARCAEAETSSTFEFPAAGIRFDAAFDGARLNRCEQVATNQYRILIEPENAPINDSAWYAFKVTANEPTTISLNLVYRQGTHRYHPQLSHDRASWQSLDEKSYQVSPHANLATLRLNVGPRPLWVAAQPLLTEKEIANWTSQLAARKFVKRDVIGRSVGGREIESFEISSRNSRNYVYIISRQHPPEVTGHQGMMDLIDAVCEDTKLATRFRDHFTTVCVPLVNPDGVATGNWRHNARGVDLNRDWGLFRQPETRAVRDAMLSSASKSGARPFLFLDYHSTYNDLYYTQTKDQPTFPRRFTADWLAAIQRRLPELEVTRNASPGSSIHTSRSWVYRTLGIPAITVEFGDNASSEHIRRVSNVAAAEMMKRLLDEVDP
jgi:murein tripeptide amidase MpaA